MGVRSVRHEVYGEGGGRGWCCCVHSPKGVECARRFPSGHVPKVARIKGCFHAKNDHHEEAHQPISGPGERALDNTVRQASLAAKKFYTICALASQRDVSKRRPRDASGA